MANSEHCGDNEIHENHGWTEVNPDAPDRLWYHMCPGVKARCMDVHPSGLAGNQCVKVLGHDKSKRLEFGDETAGEHVDSRGRRWGNNIQARRQR